MNDVYLVGGAVRDHLMGGRSHDYDFAVESGSYDEMEAMLHASYGLTVWQERPEFVTLRGSAKFSESHRLFGGLVPPGRVAADFTLCRAEAQYSDLRHPDVVTPASLGVDLSRRDFTVNAVAMSIDGHLIDPYAGAGDARARVLRCVGDSRARFTEDPLRMLRAIRFAVHYGMTLHHTVADALTDYELVALVRTLPHERVREELNKALAVDWHQTMVTLLVSFPELGWAIRDGYTNLWLKATAEER